MICVFDPSSIVLNEVDHFLFYSRLSLQIKLSKYKITENEE